MNKDPKNEQIITSQTLHDQVNAERRREGKSDIPEINAVGGASTGNLARRDKSWNSVPGFFAKMFKGAGEEEDRAANVKSNAKKESGDE